jgi:hypothetical protein
LRKDTLTCNGFVHIILYNDSRNIRNDHIPVRKKSPYDPGFVAKIRRAEKQPSKKIDLSKYGISI